MGKAAYEATTRTIGKWIVPLAKAQHIERLYETECKDHAFTRKTLERVIKERDVALAPLAANDAARITQPDYTDLWQAYVAGAKSGQKHPKADDYWLNRAADGYCKLVHATKDPEHFAAMGASLPENVSVEARETQS